jgi:hypothetical protein
MNGFDNAAWYRFDARHTAGPVFHGYKAAPSSARAVRCTSISCGKSFTPERPDTAKFCSPACRQAAYRARRSVTLGVTPLHGVAP